MTNKATRPSYEELEKRCEVAESKLQQMEKRQAGSSIVSLTQYADKNVLDAVLRITPDGYCLLNDEGYIVEVNQSYCDLLGYTKDELLKMHISQIDPIESHSDAQDHVQLVIKNESDTFLTRHEKKNGELIDIQVSASAIMIKGKYHIIALYRDISKRKKLEKNLAETEEKFFQIFQNAPMAMTISELRNGRYLYVNKAFEEFSGFKREEIIGKTPVEIGFISQAESNMITSMLASKHEIDNTEITLINRKGEKFVIELSGVIASIDGEPRLIATGRDITERKRAEEVIREREERLVESQAVAKLGHYNFDIRSGTWTNSAELDMIFGIETDYARTVEGWLKIIHPDFIEMMQGHLFDHVLKQHNLFNKEYKIINQSTGKEKWVHGKGRLKFDENNNPVEMFGTIQDITAKKHFEEELRDSEERFKALHNASFGGIGIHDQGLILDCNKGLSEITGYPYEELVGMDGLKLIAEESQNQVKRRIITGSEKPYEIYGKRKDGSKYPVRIEAKNIPYKGRTVRVVEFRDITEQKEAEIALQESENRFRSITEQSTYVISLTDENGFLQYISPACRKIFLAEPEEMIGHHFTEYLDESAHQFAANLFNKIMLHAERAESVEFLMKKNDGSRFYGEVSGSEFKSASASGVLVVINDISDRKKAEDALRESESKFRSVIEQSNDALIIIFDGRIDLANPRFSTLTGYSIDEIMSDDFDLIQLLPPEDAASKEELQRIFQHNTSFPCDIEFSLVEKNSISHVVQASISEINYGDNKAVLGLFRDVTEQKMLEIQLRQAQKIESIGHLAGGIAHDFNNLLTPILGTTELALMNMEPSNPIFQDLQQIAETADRAKDLTRQLLAFSRKQVLDVKTSDLNELITNFQRILRRTIREDIRIILDCCSTSLPVRVDISQIEQILMNLSVNAQDAMPDGGTITIKTDKVTLDKAYSKKHPDIKPGEYVKLELSDTGTGMDEATRSKAFDPFFTTKEVGKGTGLGLSTVYGIVKQHDGNLQLESEVGSGTTFTLYFPSMSGKKIGHSEREMEETALRGNETILLVEDDQSVRKIAKRFLTNYGYNVLTAEDGKAALKLVKTDKPKLDLLVTDVIMPNLNGRQVHSLLNVHYPNIPALYMSGYTQDIISHHGVLEEGIDFIQKPLGIKKFIAKVREILDR